MDMEYIFGPTDLDMRVLSKKIKSMEKDVINGKMAVFSKDNLLLIKS
jgi:hypothetical protein